MSEQDSPQRALLSPTPAEPQAMQQWRAMHEAGELTWTRSASLAGQLMLRHAKRWARVSALIVASPLLYFLITTARLISVSTSASAEVTLVVAVLTLNFMMIAAFGVIALTALLAWPALLYQTIALRRLPAPPQLEARQPALDLIQAQRGLRARSLGQAFARAFGPSALAIIPTGGILTLVYLVLSLDELAGESLDLWFVAAGITFLTFFMATIAAGLWVTSGVLWTGKRLLDERPAARAKRLLNAPPQAAGLTLSDAHEDASGALTGADASAHGALSLPQAQEDDARDA